MIYFNSLFILITVEKMKQTLNGIPETLLIPLWARAVEIKHSNPIINDHKAIEMMEQINYDFNKFDSEWTTQISIAVRTEILDNATKEFITKFPDAVIINIGCGLDTRFSSELIMEKFVGMISIYPSPFISEDNFLKKQIVTI